MAGFAAAATARWRPGLATVYVGATLAATAGFAGAGVLLAATLPFHQWDSFAFAVWSREIAEHGKIDPAFLGPQAAARPLFYELQGLLWWLTGVSFTAGRLLSLAFAVLLIAAVFKLATTLGRSRLEGAIAGAIAISIPSFTGQSLSAQTDVPAAALVALSAALAVRASARRLDLVAVSGATALAVLTKQTALLPLVPLGLVLSFGSLREHRRLVGAGTAVLAGALVGLAYDEVMALRFHTDLPTFLRLGTTGFWAGLADTTRPDAVLRADVLGAAVRLPALFALVYALGRALRVSHRLAAVVALVAAVLWGAAGPLAAGVHDGPFETAQVGFAFVGFALVLLAVAFVSPAGVPSVRSLALAAALAVPPLAAWVASATYADRLAATAWPGLAVLIALPLAAGVRALARAGPSLALVPAVVLVLAMWTSLSGLDGLHGSMWTEYRSLGWSGLRTDTRTMHVVLPALESTIATAKSQLGDGRLVTGDPMVPWFLPGRVDSATPGRCADLRGKRVFILLTGDESTAQARDAGRLATPEQWAACTSPRVRQLTDGANGYAVFAVGG
jgi:4-amino-4-deoxy-L-arabinose transferase-like glycosyltransferase